MRPLHFLVGAALSLLAAAAHSADYVAMSGPQLYSRFCAACHGASGHGDGPVSQSMRVEVPDLTLIARRAGGTYPRERVIRIIDGRFIMGAHGSRAMPVWGEDLSRIEVGDPAAEQAGRIVIEKIADYLGLLQKPSQE